MVEQVYLLAEILSVVICIFNLYGKKIKISIYLLILLTIDVMYITAINTGIISENSLPLMYVLIVFYALLEFKNKLIDTIFPCAMAWIMIAILQIIVYFFMSFLYFIVSDEDIVVLLSNIVVCILLLMSRKLSFYKKINNICKLKELKIVVCIGIIAAITVYYLYLIKTKHKVLLEAYITYLTLIIMTIYLIIRWQKANYEVQVKGKQIEKMRICGEAFDSLIETARKNQHDFHNHIMAIAGMHNSFDTYSELVEAQRKYVEEINIHTKYNKILFGIKEPILAGYLFYKISNIEQKEIDVEFKFSVTSNKIEYVSIFDLNEIIGILLDNAKEAVEVNNKDKKKIYIKVKETDRRLVICVANISRYISDDKVIELFKTGHSSKGNNRGLGLSKIKDFQKKYGFDILVENKAVEENNWIYFTIAISKNLK